jgi:hypothetical protein
MKEAAYATTPRYNLPKEPVSFRSMHMSDVAVVCVHLSHRSGTTRSGTKSPLASSSSSFRMPRTRSNASGEDSRGVAYK